MRGSVTLACLVAGMMVLSLLPLAIHPGPEIVSPPHGEFERSVPDEGLDEYHTGAGEIDTSVFSPERRAEVIDLLGDMDGHFTENKGQLAREDVAYYSHGSMISVLFGTSWVEYVLKATRPGGVPEVRRGPHRDAEPLREIAFPQQCLSNERLAAR